MNPLRPVVLAAAGAAVLLAGAPARAQPEPDPGAGPSPTDAPPEAGPATAEPPGPAPTGGPAGGAGEGGTTFEDEAVTLPGAGGPDPAPPPTTTSDDAVAPQTLDDLTVLASRARIELNLFGATQLRLSSEGHHTDFVLGPLGFVASGRMSPALTALAEFVMETTDTGEAVVDLERVVLRYARDRLALYAGRTHTEFGYWNNAFHHGTWLQPSADRPLSLRFEDDGGLLPIHWIGAWAEYRHPVASGHLRSVLAIGNGRGSNVDDIRVASDIDGFKAINLNVSIDNVLAPGSRLGGSVMIDRIAAQDASVRPALPDEPMLELIGSLFGSYRGDPWTGIVEAYLLSHRHDGEASNALFGFGLVGYTVGHYTPYLLAEARRSTGPADPFFVPDPSAPPVPDFVAVNTGVRIELSTWSSLKFEAGVFRAGGETAVEGLVDWAFGL